MIFTVVMAGAAAAVWTLAPNYLSPAWAAAARLSALICCGVAVISMIPPALVAKRHPAWLPEAGMASMVARLLLTLTFLGVCVKTGVQPYKPFAQAMLYGYLFVLVVEVGLIWWMSRRYWPVPPKKL